MIFKETSEHPIGLVSAVKFEGNLILRYMKRIKEGIPQGLNLYKGKIHNKSLVYIISGIGEPNASVGTMFLIEKFSPKLIINLGIGGAYPSSGLTIGDIAVAEKEIYGDGSRYFNKFQLDKKLIKKAVSISHATHHLSRITVKSGPFLTVSTCTGTLKTAKELERKFRTICENMEGASVAHICSLFGIPMLEIRGISNIVKDRNKKEWDVKLASENCQKAVIEFLKNYNP
jgi:futalosine hydrolase